jgi:predicted nucleic acid-binding protein
VVLLPAGPGARQATLDVVIGIIDPLHVHHERAHRWFAPRGTASWHTSPTMQNGVVRVVSHPKYPNSQPTRVVVDSLVSFVAHPQHVFIPDAVSVLADSLRLDRLLSSGQVADTYLLHLASSRGARLATFDTRVVTTAVPDGAATLFPIP